MGVVAGGFEVEEFGFRDLIDFLPERNMMLNTKKEGGEVLCEKFE